MQSVTKIPVSSVTVTRAEGPIALCRTRTFESWPQASAALLADAHTYPAGGGYDKHDLKVVFADGEVYEGRLDCKASGEDCDVAKHVREFVEYLAGFRRPAHVSEAAYVASRRADLATTGEAIAYLATYDLG